MAKKRNNELSIINKGLTMEGNITCNGEILVNGVIKGTLVVDKLVIGEEGAVYAETKAGSVTIGGKYEGNIRAMRELIVLSKGNCEGEITCKDLVVQPGGVLNGKVSRIMDTNDSGKNKAS